MLVQAFEILWAKGHEVDLVLTGMPSNVENRTTQLLRHPRQNRNLFYGGYIEDAEIKRLFGQCDALIYPSFDEGFGLPIVEAALYGLPVIARDKPVFREVGGDDVFYFDDAGAEALAASIEAWLALPPAERRRVIPRERLSTWEDVTRRMLRLIAGHEFASVSFPLRQTDEAPRPARRLAADEGPRLEWEVPVAALPEDRIRMAARCRDTDDLPKVPGAGEVVAEPNGMRVQIMHNGVKVLAGGYYGDWMQELIVRCRGHHEPQEERIFAEVVRHLPPDGVMCELGGYWSYYSIWFLSQSAARQSYVVEADPAHLEVGRINARLNGCAPIFIPARVGPQARAAEPFATESSGTVDLESVSVSSLMLAHGIRHLDVLHCDVQGVETEVLESCLDLFRAGRVGWVFLSTHSHHISGDPLTHQRCLSLLRSAGATIVAEHDVQESFSGDGLIVATFGALPEDWRQPAISYNRASESLYRHPLYDLAAAEARARPAAVPTPGSAPVALVEASQSFALSGGLLTLTEEGALGAAGETLLLPFDEVMFPYIAKNSGWQLEELQFLEEHIDAATRYAALDIGANVGLFTRQIARRFANIETIHCVEPDSGNFRALQYNLAGFGNRRCTLSNVALSSADAELEFFRETANFGNYSLNRDAMRDRAFRTAKVRAVSTEAWMRENVALDPNVRLIWKSDTQGHDELIVSLTPMDVWERVDLAIVELWRIRKPDFDMAEFRKRLESFPNRSIGIGRSHSVDKVLEFLSGDDWCHRDLYLWR